MSDTPEAQRIAIAEACGLTPVITIPFAPNKVRTGHNGDWFTPESAEEMRKTYPNGAAANIIPNYLHSLDAMHEAEKVIFKTQDWRVIRKYMGLLSPHLSSDDSMDGDNWALVHATSAQRAEAFLLTLNLWPD